MMEYSESGAVVYFVDYGHTATVPVTSLRQLQNHHLILPLQAIECTLHGMVPSGANPGTDAVWSQAATEAFVDFVDVCMKSDDVLVANIHEGDSDALLEVKYLVELRKQRAISEFGLCFVPG